MTSHSNHDARMSARSTMLPTEVLDRIVQLTDPIAPQDLRTFVSEVVHGFDKRELEAVSGVLDEVLDTEERTVRDVLGRGGEHVPLHHYRACRAEDAEGSWDFRPAHPSVGALNRGLMDGLLGPGGSRVAGIEGLTEAVGAGKRFLFISNHESVYDLVVLAYALGVAGLQSLVENLTFFVNPKIFNMPFVNFFICKSLGLIKMPQSPRIAANESVMEPDEIQRRAGHAFGVAGARLTAGDSLVIFPEGLRNEGVLHRFARAYLDLLRPESLATNGLSSDDVYLVPWAHSGVRTLEATSAAPPQVSLSFGEPVAPERFFELCGGHSVGVAGHLAAYLVARLLPEERRGLYGATPQTYLDHPHYRQRIQQHTLDDIRSARSLSDKL